MGAREPQELLDEVARGRSSAAGRVRVLAAAERTRGARRGVEELIERVLERTGYDLERAGDGRAASGGSRTCAS